jgi:hypothetical protein
MAGLIRVTNESDRLAKLLRLFPAVDWVSYEDRVRRHNGP